MDLEYTPAAGECLHEVDVFVKGYERGLHRQLVLPSLITGAAYQFVQFSASVTLCV